MAGHREEGGALASPYGPGIQTAMRAHRSRPVRGTRTARRGASEERREGRRERARQSVTEASRRRGRGDAAGRRGEGGGGRRVYTADSSACSRAARAKSTSHTSELARVYTTVSSVRSHSSRSVPDVVPSPSHPLLAVSLSGARVTCARAVRTCALGDCVFVCVKFTCARMEHVCVMYIVRPQ